MSVQLDNIGIGDLTNSIYQMNTGLNAIVSSTNNLNNIVDDNTRIKENLLNVSEDLHKRKIYNIKVREQEDAIETSKTRISTETALDLSEKGSDNLFGRVFNLTAFLGVGWLVDNYETWLRLGESFNRNINAVSQNITTSLKDILNYTEFFGDSINNFNLKISSINIIGSQNNLYNVFGDLFSSMDDMNDGVSSFFRTAIDSTVDFFNSLGSFLGINPSREGGDGGNGYFGEFSTKGGGAALYGSPEQRALLDAIAWAEGTNGRYDILFGGGKFDTSKGWKHPDTVVRTSKYASAAAGRYQMLPGTWNRAANALGLKDFSPENQDRAAIWLIDERLKGDSAQILRKEGLSDRVLNALAPEWAALPTYSGKSFYGQPVKPANQIRTHYSGSLKQYSPIMPTVSSAGAGFSTRLVTGPYGRIGSGTGYHIDARFISSLPLSEKIKYLDSMALAYKSLGREIEFSGIGVEGRRWNVNAPYKEKERLARAVLASHHEPRPGWDPFDYFSVFKNAPNRNDSSAENTAIMAPYIEGGSVIYRDGTGGDGGLYVEIYDKNNRLIFKTYHGDTIKKPPGIPFDVRIPMDKIAPRQDKRTSAAPQPSNPPASSDVAMADSTKRNVENLVNSGNPEDIIIIDNSNVAYNSPPTTNSTPVIIQYGGSRNNNMAQIVYRSLAYT